MYLVNVNNQNVGSGFGTWEIVEIISTTLVTLIFIKIFYRAYKKRKMANERKARDRNRSKIVEEDAKPENICILLINMCRGDILSLYSLQYLASTEFKHGFEAYPHKN